MSEIDKETEVHNKPNLQSTQNGEMTIKELKEVGIQRIFEEYFALMKRIPEAKKETEIMQAISEKYFNLMKRTFSWNSNHLTVIRNLKKQMKREEFNIGVNTVDTRNLSFGKGSGKTGRRYGEKQVGK